MTEPITTAIGGHRSEYRKKSRNDSYMPHNLTQESEFGDMSHTDHPDEVQR